LAAADAASMRSKRTMATVRARWTGAGRAAPTRDASMAGFLLLCVLCGARSHARSKGVVDRL
jgi:hypothetical protein